MNAKDSFYKILELLENHHKMHGDIISLLASNNVVSPAVRMTLASDFVNRYNEGWPGERPYVGSIYIDEVEEMCNKLIRQVFRTEFADCRPISGVNANMAIYSAFSKPNDHITSPSPAFGGHISQGRRDQYGTAGLVHGLNVEYYPFYEDCALIEIDLTKKLINTMIRENRKPKIAMFGGSFALFPQPLKELTEFLHDNEIFINYDAAHVAGLIAGRQFQEPFNEGADSMTMSTHKTLWGPQGGG